ncbi:MAG: hypothetical protein ACPGQL_05810 [Thermoplasmatota archaeon]
MAPLRRAVALGATLLFASLALSSTTAHHVEPFGADLPGVGPVGGRMYDFEETPLFAADPFESGEWHLGSSGVKHVAIEDGQLHMSIAAGGWNPHLNAYPAYSRDMTSFSLDMDLTIDELGSYVHHKLTSQDGMLRFLFNSGGLHFWSGAGHQFVPMDVPLGETLHIRLAMPGDGTGFIRVTDAAAGVLFEDAFDTPVTPDTFYDVLFGMPGGSAIRVDNYHLAWPYVPSPFELVV